MVMKGDKSFDCSEKQLWATCLNLSGIWSKKPVRVTRHLDELGSPGFSYWDRSGNLTVKGAGLEVSRGCITYASKNKEEVELFIKQAEELQKSMLDIPVPDMIGAKAVMQHISEWAWTIK